MIKCPFCGSRNIDENSGRLLNDDYIAWVDCLECYAQGPTRSARTETLALEEARKAWDHRGENG